MNEITKVFGSSLSFRNKGKKRERGKYQIKKEFPLLNGKFFARNDGHKLIKEGCHVG